MTSVESDDEFVVLLLFLKKLLLGLVERLHGSTCFIYTTLGTCSIGPHPRIPLYEDTGSIYDPFRGNSHGKGPIYGG